MDERLAPSKKGTTTAYFGTTALHSSYDPVKESERYVESLEIRRNIKYFILLEPVLGYIIPVLRNIYPKAKIIALRCSSFFAGQGTPDAEWSRNSGKTLQSFLEDSINDEDIPYVKIIEWRPSLDAYGSAYVSLLQEASIFMKRGASNTATAKAFGPRWIKNCFRNLAALEKVLTFTPGTCSTLVCGAGPGLETVVPMIKQLQQRENLFIIAVSSSFPALHARGIIPGLVVGSDGGNWARLHFIESARISPGNHFIGAALNAALPSQCCDNPVLVLGDNSVWQSVLLQNLGIPHMRFPQRGTVTASALDVALQMTTGRVYVSGIGLTQDDLRSHARPYAFDMLISSRTNRFHPYYSETFKRKNREENSAALGIYADWFRQYLTNHPGRIFSLGKNHRVFPEFNQTGISGSSLNSRFPEFNLVSLKKHGRSPLEILLSAMEEDLSGTTIKNELLELIQLDHGHNDITSALKQSLTALSGAGT